MLRKVIDMEKGIKEAEKNFRMFMEKNYWGRGTILTRISSNLLATIYFLMGRSIPSQDRKFCYDDTKGTLWTEAIDPTKVVNPDLLIYKAIMQVGGYHLVSNGQQTEAVETGFFINKDFLTVLGDEKWKYENDMPHYTPRIFGRINLTEDIPTADLVIAKKDPASMDCIRYHYFFKELREGYGIVLTTYDGDGDPLPSFSKDEPYFIPLFKDEESILEYVWSLLNKKYRVSIGIKFIDTTTGISWIKVINKHK